MQTVNEKILWDTALSKIELEVSKANFVTWFKNTNIKKYEDGTIYLGVPNPFVRDWLQNKYHNSILKALREMLEGLRNIEYVIYKPPVDVESGANHSSPS